MFGCFQIMLDQTFFIVLLLQVHFLIHVTCGRDTSADTNSNVSFWGSGKFHDNHIADDPSRHRLKEKISGAPITYDGSQMFLFTHRDPLISQNGKGSYCHLPAQCEPLNYTTCMGVKLPYTSTTLKLVGDSSTQEQVQDKLLLWQGLRHIPKCWAVIQPFLCAVYMPKCLDEQVDLPSQEMCKMTMGPCRILYNDKNFPSFLKCDDLTRFPPMCKNDVRELKFNTSGKCQEPLVPTDNSLAFYDGVDGCGVQCHDPLYTADEHRQIHLLIAWGGTISLLFNAFTVITFLIDWRSANKYPALIIFYINFCFLVSNIGWLAQFMPDARDDIVCRKDGTLRMGDPSAGENLSCVIVFVLVYYFMIAGIVWFVILTYAWHLGFQALGKIQERIDKKGAYFHLVAWSLPLVLTITTMALGEIDGNSVSGICFVGYVNQAIRAGFLLGPILATLLVGGYFLSRGLLTLVKLKINSQQVLSERAGGKIRQTILRIGLFSLLTFIFVVATFVCHIYEFKNSHEWKESFKKFIVCRITRSGVSGTDEWRKCKIESRPSVAMVQLHLLALFSAGVVMSSWVWTAATVETWKRELRRKLYGKPDVVLPKHKVIAQAYAKRKMFNASRMSISFHKSHDDPVGLNLEMDSLESQDFSSAWAKALPKLMTRRGALIGGNTGSVSSQRSQRRNSMDSEISFSVRRVSVESRRHSLDSQVSVHIAEMTATCKKAATPVPTGGRFRPRHKRRRRTFGQNRSRTGTTFTRRESTTSMDSQFSSQFNEVLAAITMDNGKVPTHLPNLKRRTGNAGLDDILALAFPGPESSGSDEEVSVGGPRVVECNDDGTEMRDIGSSDSQDGHISDGPPLDLRQARPSKGSKKRNTDSRNYVNTVGKSSQQDLAVNNLRNESFDREEFLRHLTRSIEAIRSQSRESEKVKSSGHVEKPSESDEETFPEPSDALSLDRVSGTSASFCAELSRLAVLSSHSGVSVGTQCYGERREAEKYPHFREGGNQSRAREIGTQTSTSLDDVQADKLYSGKPEVQPINAHQSGRLSTRNRLTKTTKKGGQKGDNAESESLLAVPLDYSCKALKPIQGLENDKPETISRSKPRKSKDRNVSNRKSALKEGRREHVILPL